MHLYTFVTDFAGGTYVSQCSAEDHMEAYKDWLDQLLLEEICSGVSLQVAQAFAGSSVHDFVAVDGLVNVWCATATAEDELVLLHLIRSA